MASTRCPVLAALPLPALCTTCYRREAAAAMLVALLQHDQAMPRRQLRGFVGRHYFQSDNWSRRSLQQVSCTVIPLIE